jgi:release factor glutamine methyltransferase
MGISEIMVTPIAEALKQATASLMGYSGSPRLDAQLILGHMLDQPREYLIAHGEELLTDQQLRVYQKLLTLRKKGMPIAYILGQRPFYDRIFKVTSHVLVPRPETEHLVEAALDWTKAHKGGAGRLIDVGTGSGAIAVTLAAHLPQATVIASDVSAAALLIAHENGQDVPNLCYVQSDLLEALCGPLDVICANLPYIASAEMNIIEVAKFEPAVALDGGDDGLTLIRRFLSQAPARLARPGLLLLEIGADQGVAVKALAQTAFPAAVVSILKDYAGLDRVVQVELQ